MEKNNHEILTVEEAAELLRIPRSSVYTFWASIRDKRSATFQSNGLVDNILLYFTEQLYYKTSWREHGIIRQNQSPSSNPVYSL